MPDTPVRWTATDAAPGEYIWTVQVWATSVGPIGRWTPEDEQQVRLRAIAQQKIYVAAELKAERLFQRVAGVKAFERLRSGNPLPITGSNGGHYFMFEKYSGCIVTARQRWGNFDAPWRRREPWPEDSWRGGHQLCAVVPRVPMYDHLLGIKLLIEHDERAFLKIAV